MARSFSVAVALLFSPLVQGEDFGRFGYRSSWHLPCFEVDRTGFRIHHKEATQLVFQPKPALWKPVQTSNISQVTILSAGKTGVLKARADLLGLGFQLYVKEGLKLGVSTTSPPFLTWSDGSVGPGVPTPTVGWIGISFRDSQPPLALGFLSGHGSVQIDGTPGDWTIKVPESYSGWIRVCAPNGIREFRTNGAAELGDFAALCRSIGPSVQSPTPKLIRQEIESDAQGVNLKLLFDAPKAVVPSHWMLAPLGGYPVKVSGAPIVTSVLTESGPIYLSSIPSINVRFPALRVPLGRAVGIGKMECPEPGTVSAIYVHGIVELALMNLLSASGLAHRQSAREALDQFFEEAHYAIEPFTKQRLPFDAAGTEIDVVASHAMLLQAMQNSALEEVQNNSLLMTLSMRRDWFSGQLMANDEAACSRAAALASLAGALSPDPERRLDGALFEAGLAARAGLRNWRARRNLPNPEAEAAAPLASVRESLFPRTRPKKNAFVEWLLSAYRISGQRGLLFEQRADSVSVSSSCDEGQFVSFGLLAAIELSFAPQSNVAELVATGEFGQHRIVLRPKASGSVTASFKLPPWAPRIPQTTALPQDLP